AVDSTGKWTYSLNNGDAKVQALAEGQKVTDSITVTVDDGHGGKATQVVTVTITGSNDAPTISGASTGAVTEDAAQSSISGQLTKTDVDATDTHTWSVNNGGKGTYGTFAVDSTGKWTYSLNNGDAKVQALAEGQKVTDSITVTVDDGHGGTATQVVTVTITGSNDAPTISGTATGAVTEDAPQSSVSGQLSKLDVDTTDTHTWSLSNGGKGTYGSFVVDATGKWTYSLNNADAKVQALAEGQKVTDSITVTVDDGHGGTATQVVTVTITGSNDAPTIGGQVSGSVKEDATQVVTGQLTKTDVDATDTHTWSLSNGGKGTYGSFVVDSNGKWTYSLDNASAKVQALADGQQVQDTITVTVSDGKGGAATQVITVTVTGTNDVPTIGGVVTGAVAEDGTLTASGQLTKTDVDTNDTHTWSLSNAGAGTYGTFTVDASGKWTYNLDNASTKVQALAAGQQVQDSITVTINDGHGGTATQVITVTVTGANDAPTISGTATGAVKEDGTSTATGQLTKTDIDASDTHTWAVSNSGAGTYGTFTVDSTGKWTYTLNNSSAGVQGLKEGQQVTDTINVTVSDGKGGTATQPITITITGTNDVPKVTNDARSVTEDTGVSGGKLSVSGAVTIADADSGESTFNTSSLKFTGSTYAGGQLGAVTINADGTYTYKVDNAAVQFLKAGQSIVETYTVASADGTATSTITITINGVNDAFPDISTTTEDQAVSGNVLLNDEGYALGGTLAVASFTVNGATYSVGSTAVNVMDAGKVVGTITVAANGGYVFTPSSDWSGKVPTVTYTTNTGVSSTLDINVTPVADTPLVTVNVGAGSTPVTTSITATSVNSSNVGHTVTAYNINGSKGTVSVVTGTDHDGFGVVGAASGDSTEIGRSSAGSESLAIQFNIPVTAITVQFAWLASGEWARYQMFDEAKKPVVLGYNADGSVNTVSGLYGFVKGGTDKVDTQFKLSVPAGNTISQIVFDAPRVDDDYLINKVTYTTATTYPVTITATPQDMDYSETITKVTVEVPKGVTLSAGTQIDATHWSLPLVSNGSYSVSIDPITKAVTITGLNMTVPENVQVSEIKVVAVASDGSSTADGSASFTSKPDAVDDTNSATLTSKSVATAPSTTTLATFNNNDSNAWKFVNGTTTVDKNTENLTSNSVLSSDQGKWLSTSLVGSTLDAAVSNSALVLRDNNGSSSGDAQLVTPTYTSTVAGTTLQFKVTGFSNASNPNDFVNWTLYKSTDGGVTWSAVPGQANSGVITGTGTYTTTALEADATYRILLTVHEGNSNTTDATVTFDDFTANVPNPDTIVWTSTAVTGSLTANDTLGTLGETSTLSVFNGSSWVNAASGGTTITGSYGTLLIKADGSYTYTPTASAAGAGKVEHFDYKLTQADGDTDTASLDISIDATGPGATTLAASRMATDTGSHEVLSTSSGDSLLGTAEDDLFIWHQGDAGTVSRPVTDVVKNFGASGNDALDLADLLQGEEASNDLSKFLHLETRTEADGKTIDTVIKVSTAGALDANGNGFNQKILVEGVDLVGSSHDQNALIKQLIDQGKLKIDHT
ncbi:VCBS domain-containing protein, partial [Comamonas testosteroni]|uniref:VCBS domain-containing protein n=1 Tax=Comamonas testosteroni TaxID=285 RepID=UPI002DBB8383